MNLYILVIVIYILFLFLPTIAEHFATSSTCPLFTLLPSQQSTTNYDPYLEINNDFFQSYLTTLFPLTKTFSEPSAPFLSQSLFPSNQYAKQILVQINKSISSISTENLPFQILSTCVVVETPSYVKWYLYLYRPEKNYGFQLQIETFEKQHYNVQLIGNIPQQDLSHVKGLSPLPIGAPYKPLTTINTPFMLPKQEQANYLVNYIKNKKETVNTMGYHCYGDSTYTRQKSCESIYDHYGNIKPNGRRYWDKPCEKNKDCPFYKANKNYDNERGGCRDGWCEMPVNIKQTSYRLYDSSTQPYCYNCDPLLGDRYMCCDQQQQKAQDAYTLMSSADYAFAGDANERQQHKDEFLQRGLFTSDINNL